MVSAKSGRSARPSVEAMHALVVIYGLRDAASAEHFELHEQLEPALAAVPGLVSRTPLQNGATGRFGSFYVFESKGAFDRFVASELYAVAYGAAGLTEMTASDFSIPNGGRNS
jgi:hypothetical protein